MVEEQFPGVYEIWISESETTLIGPEPCSSETYYLLTHTVHDEPMKLLCRFYAPNFAVARGYNNMLRDAGAFDD